MKPIPATQPGSAAPRTQRPCPPGQGRRACAGVAVGTLLAAGTGIGSALATTRTALVESPTSTTPLPVWFGPGAAGIAVALLLLALLAIHMHRLNRRLRSEIGERRRTEAELVLREQRLRLLTDNMTDVVWTMDADFRISYISPSVEWVLGWRTDEVIGLTAGDVLPRTSVDKVRAHVEAELERAAREGVREAIDSRVEIAQPHRGGTRVWTEVNLRVFFDDQGNLLGLQGVTRDMTDRKRLQDELRHMATHDSLTGIPNRRQLLEQLEREILRHERGGRVFALLMIDLDRFKAINDRHGHAVGDAVLRRFTAIVRDLLRGIDMLGRVGGEEFALLLPRTTLDEAMRVAERICRQVAETPIEVGDASIRISASIGIAEARRGESTDRLLERVDLMMYRAKDGGRNRIVTDTPAQAG